MKQFISCFGVIWLTTSCCTADVAVESLKLPEVTAEVVTSVWRSSFDYTIVTYEDDGKQHETNIHSESGWFLSLRNVKGVTAENQGLISKLFAASEGYFISVAATYNEKTGGMLIAVKAPKSLPLKEGTKIKLTDCSFRITPMGISMKCLRLEIVAAVKNG